MHISGGFKNSKGSVNQAKAFEEMKNGEEIKERIKRNKEYFKGQDMDVDGAFISSSEIRKNKSGKPMLILKMDTLENKQLMFFIQEWDNMYTLLLSLKEKQLVLVSHATERGYKKIKAVEVLS